MYYIGKGPEPELPAQHKQRQKQLISVMKEATQFSFRLMMTTHKLLKRKGTKTISLLCKRPSPRTNQQERRLPAHSS
uniref:Uncharacterized protein n=1 Tax=Arundo donax TaxID=35708 RepID=A0A0A8XVH8_ARUDO